MHNYQYSNGYDLKKVLPALTGRLGWRSDTGAKAPVSGRRFEDFHALVSEKAFKDTQGDAKASNEAWQTIKDNFENAAILRALSAVFPKPHHIETKLLFNVGRDTTRILVTNEGYELVGFEFTVAKDANVLIQASDVITDFADNTNVPLYLYRYGSDTPIWTQSVPGQAVTALTECYFSYGLHKTSTFFFGYKSSEAPQPYASAGIRECACIYEAIPAMSETLFTQVRYPSYPHGFNLEIVSQYDYTDLILKNAHLFDEIIGLVHAAMVIEQALFTNRLNSTERQVKNAADNFAAQLDLSGSIPVSESPNTDSIRKRIGREINSVRNSFKKKIGVVTLA